MTRDLDWGIPVPPEVGHPLSPQALALVGYAVSAPAATLRARMGL